MNNLYVDRCLFFLHLTGLNPQKQNVFSKLRAGIIISTTFFLTILILLNLIINWNGVDSLIESASSVAAYGQIAIKMAMLKLSQKKFALILSNLQAFWPKEEAEGELVLEFNSIYNLVKEILFVIQVLFSFAIVSYFIGPFVATTRKYPITFYQPFDLLSSPQYEIFYLLFFVTNSLMVLFLIGFNMIFIILTMHIVCELKLLKDKFSKIKNIENEEAIHQLSILVNRHDFVLKIIQNVNDMYSFVMLCIFLFTMFCICLGLFTFSGQGFPPKMDVLAQCLIFLICSSGELFIYCAGANFITFESTNIAIGIYDSDWFVKTQPNFRNGVLMVIRRSQNGERIMVAGMFELNLESFTNVMRAGMSFYTLINAVYTEA